jgi:hypothetical protein
MRSKTIIKKAKVDDKYDFYKLHLDLDLNSTIANVSYIDYKKIQNKVSEIKSYKDFQKVVDYLQGRNRSLYFSQIVHNLNAKDFLISFSENKGSNVNANYCKQLYSVINTNTKKQIISDIRRNKNCLTYNVSDNLYILEKCLNDELMHFLTTNTSEHFVEHYRYGYFTPEEHLSFLVKTCGFIPKDSFNKDYILSLIEIKKSIIREMFSDSNENTIKRMKLGMLCMDSLKSYITGINAIDYSYFRAGMDSVSWDSKGITGAINYIFSDSCEVKKEDSHEFIKDNKMSYDFRRIFYYYRVKFGKANPKLARIARSDGSSESSLGFVESLLSSLTMYTDDDISGIVSQFSDCKHLDPSVCLYRGLPKKYRYLMLSNKHVRLYCKA